MSGERASVEVHTTIQLTHRYAGVRSELVHPLPIAAPDIGTVTTVTAFATSSVAQMPQSGYKSVAVRRLERSQGEHAQRGQQSITS
jgi:hypothetical protein